MTEVTLFKESEPTRKSHGHTTETINGIQLPGQEPIFFDKRFTSRSFANRLREIRKGRTTEILTLEPKTAERLGKFCVDYLLCNDGGNDFSCKPFVDYISGFSDHVESLTTFRRDYHVSDPITTMETGRPYVATSDTESGTEVVHAMIGTARPTHGLSITGNGMPLEIIDVDTMNKMYRKNSDIHIHELQDSVRPAADAEKSNVQ